jgi:hypothetical protein
MADTAGRDDGILATVGDWGRRQHRGRRRLRWLWTGSRGSAKPGYVGLYERPGDYTGICCSGGGIRSAAFNLGALQALQQRGVLQQARYLAAVSGGAYIAGAFTILAQRWAGEPNGADSDPQLVTDRSPPFAPGAPEEQYLRNHLAYLAPNNSAKLYLALRMMAGLLVNVLLIGLPVLIVGLAAGLLIGADYGGIHHGHVVIPDGVLYAVGGFAGAAFALAVLDVIWRPRRYRVRQWAQTWEVRLFLVAAAGAVLLIAVPWLAAQALGHRGITIHDAAGRSAGTAVSSMAALTAAAIVHLRGRVLDAEKEITGITSRFGKYAKPVRDFLVSIVVVLFGPLLLVAVCSLGMVIAVIDSSGGGAVLAGAAIGLVLMWAFVDLTTVSLHPFYRRRIASAFALRRVWLDENDDEVPAPRPGGRAVARERPYDSIVALSESGVWPEPPEPDGSTLSSWPTLIVCAAANVSDPGVTPPGRHVASFTFSHAAIGGPLTGAATTRKYEALGRNRRRDLTLPAAIAMSGAALAPSMGKLTYRPLTFLLALANIRLGVWVPNPRHINDSSSPGAAGEPETTLARRGRDKVSLHRPRAHYLWKELFGRNRLEDKFLYVTDGGHYENLGLVELLRRGCRTIYCFDAGGGTTGKALGDAIALARTELNVEIDMATAAALKEDPQSGLSEAVHAVGTIKYPGEDEPTGRLYYVRSVISSSSAWDLQNYRLEDGIFPHHSTFDQFFHDQKFEAYRRLGMCAAESALEVAPAPAPADGAAPLRGAPLVA